jgi:hypothetical protein
LLLFSFSILIERDNVIENIDKDVISIREEKILFFIDRQIDSYGNSNRIKVSLV